MLRAAFKGVFVVLPVHKIIKDYVSSKQEFGKISGVWIKVRYGLSDS